MGQLGYQGVTALPSPHDILLFGHDAGLQRTRGWILNKDGFGVDCVDSLLEAKTCLAAKPYCLLVLCHSLSKPEKSVGVLLAASFLPEVKSLVLETGWDAKFDYPLASVLHMRCGPEGFRSTVHTLANMAENSAGLKLRRITVSQSDGTVKWFNNAQGYSLLGRKEG